ncbi:protein of unknown function [Candidatus Filomicrobium marinum]|uniref:Uncharacterized protein n=1 Tax=Candidatus Filomicrobium marinum TaxID=1608628 RepID=A0A0D6JGM0_9HYPH|nr:protein of unknown function [Candidatus Filomicrobium marinum]CPR19575.1 protein of unknown function [Candidatus Filomicrobium marinum]
MTSRANLGSSSRMSCCWRGLSVRPRRRPKERSSAGIPSPFCVVSPIAPTYVAQLFGEFGFISTAERVDFYFSLKIEQNGRNACAAAVQVRSTD